MNYLDTFINEVKEETMGFNELEIIRYVYIKLGRRLSFDLNFSYGTSKMKAKIYNECSMRPENLNRYLENKIIICKSSCYLLEYILKNLGVNIITIYDDDDEKRFRHVLNIIKLQDGRTTSIDLQRDISYIRTRSKTRFFGIAKEPYHTKIDQSELEKIDFKIKYITEEEYYSDAYSDLLKETLGYFTDLKEKIEFLINNLFPYESDLSYAEFREQYINQIKYYLSEEERQKVRLIDMFYAREDKRDFTMCIIVDLTHLDREIYLYSSTTNSFEHLSVEEFEEKMHNNNLRVSGNNLPRLRKKEV